MKVLVTGGAGFIGSHLVDALVEEGHKVRVLDNLDPQVHGKEQEIPEYLNKEIEFLKGDIRDRKVLMKALKDIEVISHHAAAVGIGQSMYRIKHYVEVNTLGTALLLDILANERHKVKKIIIASSMSICGEGAYECSKCGRVYPALRPEEQLAKRDWEVKCPVCQRQLKAIATDEEKPLYPTSIYAISKKDQEEMSLSIGRAYRIPTVALRYFNVYGPRQALSNPYTGVVAIFSSRVLNNHSPLIFEDGRQTRDFIHVKDIIKANLLVMKKKEADYQVFNVGSGRPISILKIAQVLIKKLGKTIKPKIENRFRAGDTRHCFADITKIKRTLGFQAEIAFEDGIQDLIHWVKKQTALDLVEEVARELEEKGLTR